MSLLIKALDHLDKNKQAEKDKQQTGDYVADEALLLELVPVDKKNESENLTDAPQAAETNTPVLEEVKNTTPEKATVDNVVGNKTAENKNLSLEEEAGLSASAFSSHKYAKTKPTVATKPSAVTKPSPVTKPSLAKELGKTTTTSSQKDSSLTQEANAQSKPAPTASSQAAFQPAIEALNQKAAAKVFVANQEVAAPSSKLTLAILGVVGTLLIWLGLQGYNYFKTTSVPDLVVLKPIAPIQPQAFTTNPSEINSAEQTVEITDSNQVVQTHEAQIQDSLSAHDEAIAISDLGTKNSSNAFKNKVLEKHAAIEETSDTEPRQLEAKKTTKNNGEANVDAEASTNFEQNYNPKNKQLTLITKAQPPGVDPTLLEAYQAFTRGEDANAQQKYRQVLQRDVRNVDALLGMAAIAQRQSRDADAQGWYQKVLEIEPRNSIAQSAMASPRANTDLISTESRIKNMIAQQPDGANLHATLGNLYAEQNQWPSAQEAYFNASRLAPNNADYAFNLAISLDQMGKANLALKQYQRALDLLNKSGGASPDRTQLEARIRELQ